MITAVLVDTVSIQRYVFAGNKLKENIGASYLVESIFNSRLKGTLDKLSWQNIDIYAWLKKPDEILVFEDPSVSCEVGLAGGGNALLFFREVKTAEEFVKQWSKDLLIKSPGLPMAVAMFPFEFSSNFEEQMSNLHKQLSVNKNKYFPQTVLPKHGITADCPVSGYSAEIFYWDAGDKQGRYISGVTYAKLQAVENAQRDLHNRFKEVLGNNYDFTTELDKLGQRESNNYVAVVHIDGNGMGERFKSCQSLQELRRLSKSVSNATNKSFAQLLDYVIKNIRHFSDENGYNLTINDEYKYLLPLRPIVLAGDDITFVCHGCLGVHLAEKFIEFWSQHKVDGLPLTASAGITVMKSKFPFYRGYRLAEELCERAKKEARANKNNSYLDFYITSGGFSGTLEQIRQKHYTVQEGRRLFLGPYILGDKNEKEKNSIFQLKNGVKSLTDTEKWPRNKVMEFRSVLAAGKEVTERFINDMKNRHVDVPVVNGGDYHLSGWENLETPYFDMIELMDFYPPFFLASGGGDKICEN